MGYAVDRERKQQAFRWTKSGGWVGLGLLPNGTHSSAAAVSADGTVVVGNANDSSGEQAFRWTQSGGMIALGFLPGGTISKANGVSADGSTVAGYGNNGNLVGYGRNASSNKDYEAFLWTQETAAR